MVLLLNVVVLVVTFLLSWSTTDSQVDLMQTTSRLSNGGAFLRPRSTLDRNTSVAFLKVVQAMDGFAPEGVRRNLGAQHLTAIYDAVHTYYASVVSGVAEALGAGGSPEAVKAACADVGKEARNRVLRALGGVFHNDAFVNRLATEIIRSCR